MTNYSVFKLQLLIFFTFAYNLLAKIRKNTGNQVGSRGMYIFIYYSLLLLLLLSLFTYASSFQSFKYNNNHDAFGLPQKLNLMSQM